MNARSLLACTLAGALCVLLGCTLDTAGKTACEEDEDCVDGRACVLGQCLADPVWGCLEARAGEASVVVPLHLVLQLKNELTDAPVPGAQVRVCTRSDVSCLQPVATLVSDLEGAVTLDMEDHYLEIEASGYLPTLVMSADSFELADDEVRFDFDLWPVQSFNDRVAQGGIVLDAQRGTIEIGTRDCGLEQAGDVSVTVDVMDAPTVVRYPINDVLSSTAVATDFETSAALVLNAEPGPRSVSGVVTTLGQPLGGTRSALVRAGWVSSVILAPDGLSIADLLKP